MKYLLTLIFLAFWSYKASSQDGLYYYTHGLGNDTIVNIFNSSTTERIQIGDSLVTQIKKGLINKDQRFILTLIDESKIEGEVFVYEGENYTIYDLYIDKITYPSGQFYISKRFTKKESN